MSDKQPAEQVTKRGRHRVPLRMRLRSGWPLMVWAGAAVILLPLMLSDSSWKMGTRIHGIVGKETVVISPEETARVLDLLVTPGETVTNGAPLVKMDTSSIDHELTEQLLDAYRTANSIRERRVDVRDTLARRQARMLELDAKLAENRLTASAERAELARLEKEQGLRQQQFEAGLMDEIERDRQQPRIAELQQKVLLREELTEMYNAQLVAAERLVEQTQQAVDELEEEAQVVDVDALLEQMQIDMEQYRDSYTLRSPCLGIVSDVLSEEGEVVRADSTVMRIIPKSLNTVVALVPEQISTLLQPGDRVWVSALNCRNDQRVNLPAMVESLSEEVRVEAALLSVGGRMIPMRSRRAMLRIEDSANTELIAGEIVEVYRNNPVRGVRGWWQGLFRSGRDAS